MEPGFHRPRVLSTDEVSRIPLFHGLHDDALRVLARHGIARSFAPGDALFRAGDDAWGIIVVLEGRVRVVRSSGERTVAVHTEGPGGTLAEVPLFAGGTLPATAIAMEPTRCGLFARDALLAAVAASPVVAFRLLERLALRVRELVERLDRITSQGVAARLAGHLLTRADVRRGAHLTLGMTQGQLAEELGTVREVIVRELRALREAGVLRASGGGRLEVLDIDALRHRAGVSS